MHTTGDYIEAAQSFNAEFWVQSTALFMNHITRDLSKRHWDGIFRGLTAMLSRATAQAAVEKGGSQAPEEHVPYSLLTRLCHQLRISRQAVMT